jgi:voltage-gated potassium channel Kch
VLAVLIALSAIAARQVVVFPLLYFTGLDRRNAEVAAIRLAQISEFSLVIAFLGVHEGHISADLSSAIIFAFVITALGTGPLYHSAYVIYDRVAPILRSLGFKDPPAAQKDEKQDWKMALLGFHRVASSLLYEIARDNPQLAHETLVIDFNVALHDEIRRLGAHVEYGDLSNPDTLHHAGIDRAHVIISTVPDDLMRGIDNRRLVENVRKLNPSAVIIANAIVFADVRPIYEAGADYVYLSRLETARGLNDALESALKGTLADYRARRETEDGQPDSRVEVLR